MSSTADTEDNVVRKSADWMRPIDDRILEGLRSEGNLTPQALDELDITAANHGSNRLSALADYGLVERVSRGLYRLTDDGCAYLSEELDASQLEPIDERLDE